jgi:hypothetical protein
MQITVTARACTHKQAHTYIIYSVNKDIFVQSKDSDICLNILMKYKCHMNLKQTKRNTIRDLLRFWNHVE